jgi:hypothetical protein
VATARAPAERNVSGMVRESVSLRWSEEKSFVARVFYKHHAPTGRGTSVTWLRLVELKTLSERQEITSLLRSVGRLTLMVTKKLEFMFKGQNFYLERGKLWREHGLLPL